jgi:hypothetical protein
MKTHMSLGVAALTALTLTLPAMAATSPSPMTPCPITIRSFEVTPALTDPVHGRRPGADFVTFRDARTVAASHVTFSFYGKNGLVKSATTKGLFSPGIDIQKQFPDVSDVEILSVIVAKADFADGIVCRNWKNAGAVFKQRKHFGPTATHKRA